MAGIDTPEYVSILRDTTPAPIKPSNTQEPKENKKDDSPRFTQMLNDALKGGDKRQLDQAAGAVYARYYDELVGYVRRSVDPDTAEEIVQGIFERMWRRLPNTTSDFVNIRAWLYSAAGNALIDRSRIIKKHGEDVELSEHLPDTHPTVEAQVLRALGGEYPITPAQLRRCMTKLPERYRQLLQLRFVEGLTHPKIAEELGANPGTIKVACHRALRKLQELVSEELVHTPSRKPAVS